jgi:septal ring-binding cell division protein DamX
VQTSNNSKEVSIFESFLLTLNPLDSSTIGREDARCVSSTVNTSPNPTANRAENFVNRIGENCTNHRTSAKRRDSGMTKKRVLFAKYHNQDD